MRRLIVAVLSCCLILIPLMVAVGQERGLIVSGKVTDQEGNPLPGANVILSEFDLGAASDINGNYRFTVPAKYLTGQEVEICARFIGYHACFDQVAMNPGTKTLDFSMQVDVLEMDAVVVTGVAEETPKKLLPFTVNRVSNEQIEMVPQQSPVAGLQGKVAGVHVVSGSGEPGEGLDVRLRGSTNIGEGNSPMYIVDGVILTQTQVDVDAMDIESIEVVKGAAAAAIYGSRAASGIINIRTKRGNTLGVGQTRIRVRSEIGMNQFPGGDYRSEHHHYAVSDDGQRFLDNEGVALTNDDIVDPLTGFVTQYGDRENYLKAALDGTNVQKIFQDNEWPTTIETYDHLEQFFDPGTFMRNNIMLTQHRPGFNFALSFGTLKEPGVISGVKGYRRQNVRLNLDQKLRDDLDLGTSLYYASSWRDDPQGSINPFFGMMFMAPMANLEADNEDDGVPYDVDPDPRCQEENPLYASHTQDIDRNFKRVMGSFDMTYSPVTWFNIEGRFSYDRRNYDYTDYYPFGFKSFDGQNEPTGQYRKYHRFDEGINGDITASFYRAFGDLSTKTKIRYHYEQDRYEETNAQGENLAVNGVKDLGNVDSETVSVNSWQQLIRAVGYYGSIDVDYKEKYLASALVRYDGSSLFGEDERYHLYYRGSVAWRVSQESFWFTDKINEFKIRASYGTAGSRPGFDYQFETLSVSGGAISKTNLGNKSLKPAFSQEFEVGVEIAFLDRFSLEVVYSQKNTDDQILRVPLAAYSGYGSQWQNAGDLETNTIEAELRAFLIQQRDMSWSAGVTFDRTRETITKLNAPPWRAGPYSAFYMRENETHGAMYGYKWMTGKNDLDTYYVDDETGGWAQYKDAFDVDGEGYLVAVGSGNTWKSGVGADGVLGTDDDLWGTDVDIDGDGTVDLDWGMPLKYTFWDEESENTSQFDQIGSVIPDFSLGFTTTFQWKGLTLYALIDAQIGGNIYNGTRQWAYRELRHHRIDQYGMPDNEKRPVGYYSILYDTNKTNSHFVEDGTYVKLREVSLQYRFDRSMLSSFAGGVLGQVFHGITIGAIGRNLLTFTDYSGFDPEVGSVEYRVDNFAYPHFRQITGMIEFEF